MGNRKQKSFFNKYIIKKYEYIKMHIFLKRCNQLGLFAGHWKSAI
jgi:hypothetical protein